MKSRIQRVLLGLTLLSTLDLQPTDVFAQPSAFTYQGQLNASGVPVTGVQDFEFRLFTAESGGVQVGPVLVRDDVGVTNGLFTVTLDFNYDSFTGPFRWLEIAVRPGSETGAYTSLTPRQALTSAPHAVRAHSAELSTISQTVTAGGVNTSALADQSVIGAKLADSAVNSAKIADGSLTAADLDLTTFDTTFWRATGNSGTTPGTHFLGTRDNQPLELRVSNQRALRLQPGPNAPNVIGGSGSNSVSPGLEGTTIAGGGLPLFPNRATNSYATIGGGTFHLAGGAWSTIAGGRDNVATGDHASVAGGYANVATGSFGAVGGGEHNSAIGELATVSGGWTNNATGRLTTVGGGYANLASGYAATVAGGEENTNAALRSNIGGGFLNQIGPDSWEAVVAGGSINRIGDNAAYSTISGGRENVIGSNAWGGIIPGGYLNSVSAPLGLAAGQRAKVNHAGTFLWADLTDQDFASTSSNQFLIRASGGVAIGTNDPAGATLRVAGSISADGYFGMGSPLRFGTIDNQPLRFNVNSQTGLRLEPTASTPNIVGGWEGNYVAPGVLGATIAGGGSLSVGSSNRVEADFATVGGGAGNGAFGYSATVAGGLFNVAAGHNSVIAGGDGNRTETNTVWSTIGGGRLNYIQANLYSSTIAGGEKNRVSWNSSYAFIGGGILNSVSSNVNNGTIAGGVANRIESGATAGAIAGGESNLVSAPFASVGGGRGNYALGEDSIVAGGTNNAAVGHASFVGGGLGNGVPGDFAAIDGGQYNTAFGFAASVGGGQLNRGTGDYAAVGGGKLNMVLANFGTVSGGVDNNILSQATYSTIGGGGINEVNGLYATIAGGWQNQASAVASVGGGLNNVASGSYSTIGGGYFNSATGFGATVPGGYENLATNWAFAAGYGAKARHDGAFVWADSSGGNFYSSASNQFLIRAGGGVGIGTGNPQGSLHVYYTNNPTIMRLHSASGFGAARIEFASDPQGSGSEWRPGYIQSTDNGGFTGGLAFVVNGTGFDNRNAEVETMRVVNGRVGIGTTTPVSALQVIGTVTAAAFNPTSDRNLKENFEPVSAEEVLEKVAALPISRWNFKGDSATPHLGPMAQDFHAAFGLGTDDKHIATVDADGVALAAIQGLNQKLEDSGQKAETRIRRLESENAELRERLDKLEKLRNQQVGGAR